MAGRRDTLRFLSTAKVLAKRLLKHHRSRMCVSVIAFLCREQWLECCKRAFEGLERDSAGRVTSSSLLEGLRSRLPAAEIDYAVEDALIEAGYASARPATPSTPLPSFPLFGGGGGPSD